MAEYEILSLDDAAKWRTYLEQLPIEQQDIYYTPEYYQLYEELGDGKALCFVFISGNSIALYPFLINSVNNLGYNLDKEYFDIQGAYGYNCVVSSSLELSFVDEFFKEFNSFCINKNIIAEFTRCHPVLNNYLFSQKHLETIYDRQTVILNYSESYQEIWDRQYSGVNRNMIRKAMKNEIEIEFDVTLNGLLEFADLYRETMNDLNSLDYYQFKNSYFENIFNLLIRDYDLILAHKNNQLIAGALFFHYGEYYHYHLAARKREYKNFATNNLILNEAVKKAEQIGCKIFHFGGGTDNSPDNSLLKFKSNFSRERGNFFIGKKIHNQKVYNEVIKQWEEKNPKHNGISKNILLRYRNL